MVRTVAMQPMMDVQNVDSDGERNKNDVGNVNSINCRLPKVGHDSTTRVSSVWLGEVQKFWLRLGLLQGFGV